MIVRVHLNGARACVPVAREENFCQDCAIKNDTEFGVVFEKRVEPAFASDF